MMRTKNVSIPSVRAKILKEKKQKKLEKAREDFAKQQAAKMLEKEKQQVLKYQELKHALKVEIYDTPGMTIISEEENFMLVAKSTKVSVNIIRNANGMQPYHKSTIEDICIISLIDFGRRKTRSELYDTLADVCGCKVYRVSHIDDIDDVLKKLDQI